MTTAAERVARWDDYFFAEYEATMTTMRKKKPTPIAKVLAPPKNTPAMPMKKGGKGC